MRASDSDRQRTIEELRRHCAAGRIDVDEYARRIEVALGASDLDELDRLRADLPMLRIPDPAGTATGRVWADRGRTTALSGEAGPRALPGGAGPTGGFLGPRVTAAAIALVSVLVVLSAVVLTLAAQWTWAEVLLAGWVVGLLQGRLGRSRRR